MDLHSRFITHLQSRHPGLSQALSEHPEMISENLLSPFVLELPRRVFNDIQKAVEAVHGLRAHLSGSNSFSEPRSIVNPGNEAIMMSLDFHLDASENLKLIEINTNAAFLILNWEMYQFRGIENPVTSFSPEMWKQNLLQEWSQFRKRFSKTAMASEPFVAISDEAPEQQRLFIEFLVAREWIRSWGWPVEIRDFKDLLKGKRPDLVYNRSTDFYFEQPVSAEAREAFLKGDVCFSPNPYEYALLADKERLIEWSRPGFLEKLGVPENIRKEIHAILPLCVELSADRAEELWAQRKHLFFKPKREFGSKKAFRGASVSRRVFDEIVGQDMLAQEYVPAPEKHFVAPEGEATLKYDLRCHFYQDRLESVFARLYQGQVTNLKTPLGGFTPVVFK